MRRPLFAVVLLCAVITVPPAGAANSGAREVSATNVPRIVTFPDSSQLTLGRNTTIEVGPYRRTAGEDGSTIGLSRAGGLRIAVRHWKGGTSRYTFWTSTMWVSVRGTALALLWDGPPGSMLTCLYCWANDVVATVGGRDYALLTGETMLVARNGKVAIDATNEGWLQNFRALDLSI